MEIKEISDLEKALENSWCKETSSYHSDWSNENNTCGQCAPNSLIVNDYFGGEIVSSMVVVPDGKMISHYFNIIGGKEIDLTRKQFPKGSEIPQGVQKKKNFKSTRDYLLSIPSVVNRYKLLKQKVQDYLDKRAQVL